ncbi:MAG TPA: hypothetical protein VF043_07820 [Ktedonobacteraceae bacterium]
MPTPPLGGAVLTRPANADVLDQSALYRGYCFAVGRTKGRHLSEPHHNPRPYRL